MNVGLSMRLFERVEYTCTYTHRLSAKSTQKGKKPHRELLMSSAAVLQSHFVPLIWRCGPAWCTTTARHLHNPVQRVVNDSQLCRRPFLTSFCLPHEKVHTRDFTSQSRAANPDFRLNILSIQMSSHSEAAKCTLQTKLASPKITPLNLQISLD